MEKLHIHAPNIHPPHIGKRKLKSLLALFLGFCLWQVIRIPFPGLEVHPIFIYLYGLIEIRDTSEKTVTFGKLRIRSTIVGLAVGLVMVILEEAWFMNYDLGDLRVAAELGLLLSGTLLTLLVAEKTDCKEFCGMAAIVYIILLLSHEPGELFLYAALRAVQTILGVLIAWYVNVMLFPYEGKKTE